jgi:iron complex outermembrane receptor protein
MLFVSLLVARAAAAEEHAPDVEVPSLVLDDAPAAHEEQSEIDLGEMVLSAAKRVESVLDNEAIVSIVTHEEIAEHGYLGVADVLDTIPGFEGYRPSYTLVTADAFARGNPRTVLYLWNGVPLNSPQNNRRALGPYLPLDAVERIEVVSGPGGVLWGADAFLGIVSLSTLGNSSADAAVDGRVALGTGARSRGEYLAAATLRERWLGGRVKLRGTAVLVTSSGPQTALPYDVTAGPGPAPDADGSYALQPSSGVLRNQPDVWLPLSLGVDAGPLHLEVLYPVISRQYTEVNDRGLRTDQFVSRNGMVFAGESSRRAESVTLASLGYDDALTARSHLVARAYATGFEDLWARQIFEPPGLFGAQAISGGDRYAGIHPLLHDGAYRYGATVDVTHERARSRLVLGGEAFLEGTREIRGQLTSGLSSSEFVRQRAGRRTVVSAYAQNEWLLLPRLGFTLGARTQVAPGSYAPVVLGAVATRVGLAKDANFKLNVTQGFRPPAFDDTHGNDDPFTNPYPHRQSNPALAPERSLSAEVELTGAASYERGALQRVWGRAGYQYTRLDDLIVLGPTGAPENTNRRVIHTVELRAEARWRGHHRMIAGYAFLVGEDLETGPMRNVPQHRLSLAWDLGLGRHLRGFLGLIAGGASEDLDRQPIVEMSGAGTALPAEVTVDRLPPFATVNLGLRAPGLVHENLDVALHVDNLFDERHPIPDPSFDSREALFPVPSTGRSVMLSIVWRN